MKNYLKFSVNDFAMDDYFQSWVLRPDEHTNAFWKTWLLDHPEKIEEINEAREILKNFTLPTYNLSQDNVAELWNRIQTRPTEKIVDIHRVNSMRWYGAAAAVLVIGVATLFLFRASNLVEYQTQFGETKTILLPDSSTVILNANSYLTFNKNWDQLSTREVQLNGEAYFSVIHKQDHQPFKVITPGGIAVEVLGTTFDVYHREETKVVLNSGQITLSFPVASKEKKILMKPGEMVEYKKDKYSKRLVNASVYAAWTEKKIILDQTTLQEMIQMIEDNYGIVVKVESEKMLKQTVSGSMPIGDANSFVNQVAMAFQLNVIKNNDIYLLKE